MKIQFLKFRKSYIFIFFLVVMITCFLWLNSSVKKRNIEESIYEHLTDRLDKNIEKVDCYGEAVGKYFRPQLVCNYALKNSKKIIVKHIDIQDEIDNLFLNIFSSDVQINEIFYEKNSSRNVLLIIGGSEKLNKSDLHRFNTLADAISKPL